MPTSRYRIVLRGRLSERFESAFEGMALELGPNQTVLVGDVRDQAHLYGLLDRLRDFGIELVAVEQADIVPPVPGLADDPVRGPEAAAVDDALLQRLISGDEQAFDHLVRTWSPAMRRVARGFVSTDASAQECVQDAWLGVVKGLASFEGRSTLRTWIFRILVNIAKTRAVKEQRTTPLSSLASDEDAGPTVDPRRFRPRHDPERPGTWTSAGEPRLWETDPETGALSSELRDVVWAAVEALPGRQREVVILRDVQGFGSEDVCEILGLTPENQRVLLHRARAKVRAALEAYYSGEIT